MPIPKINSGYIEVICGPMFSGKTEELIRRVNKIVNSDVLSFDDSHKIYWKDNPIAYLRPGKNYLSPKIELIVDEAIDEQSKEKLKNDLEKKLQKLITYELSHAITCCTTIYLSGIQVMCLFLYFYFTRPKINLEIKLDILVLSFIGYPLNIFI